MKKTTAFMYYSRGEKGTWKRISEKNRYRGRKACAMETFTPIGSKNW